MKKAKMGLAGIRTRGLSQFGQRETTAGQEINPKRQSLEWWLVGWISRGKSRNLLPLDHQAELMTANPFQHNKATDKEPGSEPENFRPSPLEPSLG